MYADNNFPKNIKKILSAYEDKIPKKVNSLLLITLTLSYTGVFGLTDHGRGGGGAMESTTPL